MLKESYLLDFVPPGSSVHTAAKLVKVEGDLNAWCKARKMNSRKLFATAKLYARTEGDRHKGYRLLTQSDKYGEVISDFQGYYEAPKPDERRPYCPATATKARFRARDRSYGKS